MKYIALSIFKCRKKDLEKLLDNPAQIALIIIVRNTWLLDYELPVSYQEDIAYRIKQELWHVY